MKLFTYLFSIAALLTLWACTEDPYSPDAVNNEFKIDKKDNVIKAVFASGSSYVLQIKIQNNYQQYDSITLSAVFKELNDSVKFYDDGGVHQGSIDLIAKNGIWTASFIPDSNIISQNDTLLLNAKMYLNGQVIDSASQSFPARIQKATAPIIGQLINLDSNDSLMSGFAPLEITLKVTDNDNLPGSYEDSLKAYFYINNQLGLNLRIDSIPAYFLDSNRFVWNIDSTFSAGLKTAKYNCKFSVIDKFGLSSTKEISNLFIENTPPTLKKINFPDSASFNGTDTTTNIFNVRVNDKQGFKLTQDIQEVKFVLYAKMNLPDNTSNYILLKRYNLFDNGIIASTGDSTLNDAKYSCKVKFFHPDATGFVSEKYYYNVTAIDKTGDSLTVRDSIKYYRPTPTKFKGKK